MKLLWRLRHAMWALCLLVCALAYMVSSVAVAGPDRQVAVTVDDLPAGAANAMSAATITEMTSKLLAALRQQKGHAVGFGNEKKVYQFGKVDERIKALGIGWDSGFEVWN